MAHRVSRFGPRSLVLSLTAAAALAGCGGVDYITVSGVAAKGTALAGAAVSVTCAGGTQPASVTTNNNGSYNVIVTEGQAPCLVTASKTENGTTVKYEAITAGSGSSLTVNVTPVSTIIVELLKKDFGSGSNSADLVKNSAAQSALTGSVSTFVEAVQTAITNAAAGNNPNPVAVALRDNLNSNELQTLLTGSFTPAVGNTAGDAIDVKLDAVVAALGSNLISKDGVINTTALQQAIATIDVPLAGTSGATGGAN